MRRTENTLQNIIINTAIWNKMPHIASRQHNFMQRFAILYGKIYCIKLRQDPDSDDDRLNLQQADHQRGAP